MAIYVSNTKFTETAINILTEISEGETPENGEFLFIEIDTGPKDKNIIIGNTYRSPAHKPDLFIENLNTKITALRKNNNKHIMLMGDVNVNMLNYDTCNHAQQLFNSMTQLSFIPVISRPTRITHHSMTLIDHIYTNSLLSFKASGIILDPFADHLGVYMTIHTSKMFKVPVEQYTTSNFSESNMNKFKNLINKVNWDTVLLTQNANDKYENFQSKFNECYNTCFPKETKTRKNKRITAKPCIKPWLIEACTRKNEMYKNFIKQPNIENKNKYKNYKKKVEKCIYIWPNVNFITLKLKNSQIMQKAVVNYKWYNKQEKICYKNK